MQSLLCQSLRQIDTVTWLVDAISVTVLRFKLVNDNMSKRAGGKADECRMAGTYPHCQRESGVDL